MTKGRRSLTIGRDSSCDLCLADDTVSRRHAVLDFDPDGRYRLRDLGSLNGTWRQVEGGWRRIGDARLADGDVLRFGEVELTFGALLRHASETGAEGARGVERPAMLISGAAPEDPGLERPRRNPKTGEVEESR